MNLKKKNLYEINKKMKETKIDKSKNVFLKKKYF